MSGGGDSESHEVIELHELMVSRFHFDLLQSVGNSVSSAQGRNFVEQ